MMLNLRIVLAMLAVLAISGCARLSITQYSFQGDLSRGERGRLAVGRGIARAIQDKLEARGAEFWSREEFDRRVTNVTFDDDRREVFASLFEFAARAERHKLSPGAADLRREIDRDVERLRSVIRFPGFDQIALDEADWKRINPVRVFGGFGKSEFIIVRDDSGNYSIKSAAFDPSKVMAATIDGAFQALSTVAAVYGVPVRRPLKQGEAAAPPGGLPTTTGTPSAQTPREVEMRRAVAGLLDNAALRLTEQLRDVAQRLAAGGELKGATQTAALEEVRRSLLGYVDAIRASSAGDSLLNPVQQRAQQLVPPAAPAGSAPPGGTVAPAKPVPSQPKP